MLFRSTFLNAPVLLADSLQLRSGPRIFFAGQITGVEGYVESTAMGLLAGINASRFVRGMPIAPPPRETAIGALVGHITGADAKRFQPMNVAFGLFPPLAGRVRKPERGLHYARRALAALAAWQEALGENLPAPSPGIGNGSGAPLP